MGKREDGSREGKQDLSRKLSPLPFNKDMWNWATCAEWGKGILWFVKREILKRKPIFMKFRKLVKNWRKNINEEHKCGKEMRAYQWPRIGGETMDEGEHRDWRVQIVCSEFSLILGSLLWNVLEILGHKKYWKHKINFSGICGSAGWLIKAWGRNGQPVSEEVEFLNQLFYFWYYCYVSSGQLAIAKGRSHGSLSTQWEVSHICWIEFIKVNYLWYLGFLSLELFLCNYRTFVGGDLSNSHLVS